MVTISQDFQTVRRTSTPLVGIETSDIQESIRGLLPLIQKDKRQCAQGSRCAGCENCDAAWYPVLIWDVVRGLQAIGNHEDQIEAGKRSIPADYDPTSFEGPAGLILALREFREARVPNGAALFIMNAQAFIGDITVKQAIANCRDHCKGRRKTVVLMGPSLTLEAELQDVVLLNEPLPDRELLASIAMRIYRAAGVEPPEGEADDVVDGLIGLAAFPAEQAVAMSMTPDGVDMGKLWERKRQEISQTQGLSVYQGGERFGDIGGLANLKAYLSAIIRGKNPPKTVVWVDEIEKMLAGVGGDNTGISQDYLGQLLSFMQDNEATGLILVGPPGASKSMIAKATGAEAGVPTIQLDLGGMKGSLVGQSEQALRRGLKIVNAISGGDMLFIATCNSFANLPPELRRRFTYGTIYCDLPDEDERAAIWSIYMAKYELSGPLPESTDWTGAEIKQCCVLADRLGITLQEASAYIVPVAIAAAETIERLRAQAEGRFISATHPGPYRRRVRNDVMAEGGERAFGVTSDAL